MSDPGPTVFNGRYELHRRLARGGMSDVYLARDLLLDRPVAVKVLFPEFAKDANFVERFRREAKAAANLNHPNIVAIYDWGEQDETYFIVMEYVEGRSLADIIRTDGRLDARRAAEVAADIAAALSFAHRNGVVHRDIKPGNVLVSPLGQVKVADFGIAQAASTTTNLTQAGSVMGTATYFSPEQAQGKPVDPRSDLYSLGCVLFEMLTASPPFTGDTPVAIAYKHVQEQAPAPSSLGVNVPAGLEAITLKLLAKDPADRFASADDLRSDLTRYLDGHKVVAAPVAPAPATTVAPRAPAPVPLDDYGDDEPRSRGGIFAVILVLLLAALGVALFYIANNLSEDDSGQVAVPNLIGKTFEEAEAELKALGLEVTPVSQPNTNVPENQVFDQDPAQGARVEKGTAVTVTFSTGEKKETVPTVTGLTAEAANSLLETKGFIPNVKEEYSDTVAAGEVISQDPAAGEEVPKGSVVSYTVSKGSAPVTIPDLRNRTSEEAQQTLLGMGLKVSVRESPSPTVAVGLVITTEPGPDESVEKGSKVTVVVSSGPPPTSTSTSSSTTTTKPPTSSTSSSSTTTSTSSTTTTTS